MEIRIGYGGVPTDHDIVADSNFQLAEQYRIHEVTMVSNRHECLRSEREVYSIHRAVRAYNQGGVALAEETLKSKLGSNNCVLADASIGRQLTIGPVTCLSTARFHLVRLDHQLSTSGLQTMQIRVASASLQEIVVRARFDQLSSIQHKNPV